VTITSKGSEEHVILEALEDYYAIRLELEGGYPADIDGETIPDHIAVADISHKGEPELHIYRWDYARGWYARALKYQAEAQEEGEECRIGEALSEVEDDVP